MTWSASQFYAWFASLLNVSQQSVEQWIWSSLILGFVFATVHLVTMLVTRWGDHHATSKSLLFSVLIHLSSGAGVIVLAPGTAREQGLQEQAPIRIQEIILSGTHQTRTDAAGNTPIWETIPFTETPRISRLEREEFPLEPSQSPERMLEQSVAVPVEVPALAEPLPRPVDQPALSAVAPSEKMQETARIPELEQAELPSLPAPEMTGPADTSVASRSPRPRSITETETLQRPESGGVDRISPEFMEPLRLRSPEVARGPEPDMPARGEPSEVVERRQAPEQASAEGLKTGEQIPPGEGPSQAARVDNRAVTRSSRGSTTPADPTSEQLARMVPTPTDALLDSASIPMSPLVASPEQVPRLRDLPEFRFEAVRRGDTAEIPATYRLRDLARRKEIARQNGGTDASEEAVERSLAWLASVQEPEGYWDGSKWGSGRIETDEAGINRQRAGAEADTGLTGLAVLAFLGAGYTQEEGKYSRAVGKALDWIISKQREDGYLGGNATRYAGMYCHGMAAYALAEAYGMRSERQTDDRLGQAVARAVQFTVGMQNRNDGGWRYLPDWSGDMSMFGWQMMALKSADIAGIAIPETARNLMLKFLVDRSLGPQKGLAAYHPEYGPEITTAMTAEALFCKQMMGIPRNNPASREAVEYLLDSEHVPRKSYPNLYYWYYGTLAMYQYGGAEWTQWNNLLRELLVESQVKRGPLAGSWNPDGPWGGYGGRIYSTALATLSLEVYYRFLPLYRLGNE